MTNQITPESISLTVHQNTPVITTELLAGLYGSSPKLIRQNYQRNAERFVAGKHFFKLTGAELKVFKNEASKRGFVKIAPTTNHLILWTERGAARHAKMLETDQAWEVFEKLEDCYFAKKVGMDKETSAPPLFSGILALYFESNQVVRVEATPGRAIVGTIDMFERLIKSQGAVVLWSEEQRRDFVKDNLMKMLS